MQWGRRRRSRPGQERQKRLSGFAVRFRVKVPTLLQNPAVSCPISVSVKHWHGPSELIQWKYQAPINACSNTKLQLPSLPQEQAASAQPQLSDLGSVSKAKRRAERRKGATNWKWGCGLLVRGMIRAQKGAGRKRRGAIQAQGTVRTVRWGSGPCCSRCAGEVSTPTWKCLRKTGNSWDTGCKNSLGINRFDWNESPKNLPPNSNYYNAQVPRDTYLKGIQIVTYTQRHLSLPWYPHWQ